MNVESSAAEGPKLIAFYLTQFHPTQENDEWWGKGFTEWTNVTKAQPLFVGHYQPHLPTDLGFYDLRVRDTRRDQIRLAKEYGIGAFCYHYYWFSGTRLLNAPFDDMLADQESDMPFCICWANENWTRRWDAAEHQVLIAQKYLFEDDLNFIRDLIPVLQDNRYLKLDRKPIIIVYRPQHLPDCRKTFNVWRQHCREVGLGEIHIVVALTHGNTDYEIYSADGGVEFPPHNLTVGNINRQIQFHSAFAGNVMQFADIAGAYLKRAYTFPNVYRTVFPSWDNTARTGARALVTLNGTPENYEYWLAETLRRHNSRAVGGKGLVFINAWNEWAEGCHLEPDRVHGRKFLEATARAVSGSSRLTDFPDIGVPRLSTSLERTLFQELALIFRRRISAVIGNSKLKINRHPRLKKILLPIINTIRAVLDK